MKENNVSRRDFVKTLGVVGVGSMVGASQTLAQSNAPAASTILKFARYPNRQ